MSALVVLVLAAIWTGSVLVVMTLLWANAARQAGASPGFDSPAGASKQDNDRR